MTRTWTEGVCSDGAAILCDGVPVPISELLTHLNRCEFIRSAALEEAARVAEKYREIAAQNSSFRDPHLFRLLRHSRKQDCIYVSVRCARVAHHVDAEQHPKPLDLVCGLLWRTAALRPIFAAAVSRVENPTALMLADAVDDIVLVTRA